MAIKCGHGPDCNYLLFSAEEPVMMMAILDWNHATDDMNRCNNILRTTVRIHCPGEWHLKGQPLLNSLNTLHVLCTCEKISFPGERLNLKIDTTVYTTCTYANFSWYFQTDYEHSAFIFKFIVPYHFLINCWNKYIKQSKTCIMISWIMDYILNYYI